MTESTERIEAKITNIGEIDREGFVDVHYQLSSTSLLGFFSVRRGISRRFVPGRSYPIDFRIFQMPGSLRETDELGNLCTMTSEVVRVLDPNSGKALYDSEWRG